MGLERRPLNEDALAFIVERLEASGPLGERLVKARLRGGRLFTIADTVMRVEQLHAFARLPLEPTPVFDLPPRLPVGRGPRSQPVCAVCHQ